MKDVAMFKLKGLSRTYQGDIVGTCELLKQEVTFISKIDMSDNRKEALWKYFENNWPERVSAKIEFEKLNSVGIPINPIIKAIW